MGVKLVLCSLFVIGLLLLSSCTYEQPVKEQQWEPIIYVVGEPQISEQPQVKTFVIEEKDSLAWAEETKSKRNELNTVRAVREDEDSQKEFELKSKLSNVRRTVDDELIIGYDEELDNPRWMEVDD